MNKKYMIEANGLSKSFGKRKVIDNPVHPDTFFGISTYVETAPSPCNSRFTL